MDEGKPYQIEARPKDTVKVLKAVLNLELGILEQAIELSCDGQILSDDMLLKEVDLQEGSKLQMLGFSPFRKLTLFMFLSST